MKKKRSPFDDPDVQVGTYTVRGDGEYCSVKVQGRDHIVNPGGANIGSFGTAPDVWCDGPKRAVEVSRGYMKELAAVREAQSAAHRRYREMVEWAQSQNDYERRVRRATS